MGEATRVVRKENLPKIGQQIIPTAVTPRLRLLVDEHVTDDDLAWINSQLTWCGTEAMRMPVRPDLSWVKTVNIR